MNAFFSQIINISTGYLNTVADTVAGGVTSGMAGATNGKFQGQLGKLLAVAQDQIAPLYDSSVGTLYGGVYQYVKFSDDLGTPAPEIGQALFWDPTADAADFVVLDDDGLTGVPQPAGVYIGGPGAGEYGFIQIAGLCEVLTAQSLAIAPTTGQGLVVAATGLFNNASSVTNPNYAAYAIEIPANFTLIKAQMTGFGAFRG